MSIVAGAGLRETVRQLYRTQLKATALVPVLRQRSDIPHIADILQHLDASPQAMKGIRASGAKSLLLGPCALEQEHDHPPLLSTFATAAQAAEFAGFSMTAGDPMLVFNPRTYGPHPYDWKGVIVQRELWNLFMKQAFPGFAQDLGRLKQESAGQAAFFSEYFLTPLFHFAARVAMMESQCHDFAANDSTGDLFKQAALIWPNKSGLSEHRTASALFSGLLFAHVFCFELFPLHAPLAGSNLQVIRRLLAGILDGPNMGIAEAVARTMLADTLLPRQTPDVKMDGYYARIRKYWGWVLRGGEES